MPDTNRALKWLCLYKPLEVVYNGAYRIKYGRYFRVGASGSHSSYLYLKKDFAVIDTSGNVYTKFAFIHTGYWFNERIADKLPFDYTPDR